MRIVHRALVTALAHAIEEVRLYAALGAGEHLWAVDRKLAMRCVNALAMESMMLQNALDAESSQSSYERREFDDIEKEAAAFIRRCFNKPGAIGEVAFRSMDMTTWRGARACRQILVMLWNAPDEPEAIAAFKRPAYTLVSWWDNPNDQHGQQHYRDIEVEPALSQSLENFLLKTSTSAASTILQPILDAIDRNPREVHGILLGLISAEDRRANTQQFWSLWELFAHRVRQAVWLPEID